MPRITLYRPPRQRNNPAMTRNLDEAAAAFRDVSPRKKDIHGGHKLTSVALTTGTTLVPHLLGRKPAGWDVVRSTVAGFTAREVATSPDPTKFLALVGSAADTVDLWVF